MDGKRWDSDMRGRGVASGAWIAPSVQRLLDALAEPDWIAEQPEEHLLPGLRRVMDAPGSVWTLVETSFEDGVFDVMLEWSRREPSFRLLRADAHTLIGSIAEGTTFICQVIVGDVVEYPAATGLLDGDSPFKGHGHQIRLRVVGPSIRQVIPAEVSNSP